jgi:hypothetical protein
MICGIEIWKWSRRRKRKRKRKRGAKEASENEAEEGKKNYKKINGGRDFEVKFGENFLLNLFWGKSKEFAALSKFWFFSKIW